MKTGLVCLAGAAAADGRSRTLGMQVSNRQNQAVSRTSLKKLLSIPTTCRQCPSGCGILAHLDGDRCLQLSGNPAHPVNRGSICAKGIAGLNLTYDPDRLLFPMKRIGVRGSGDWTRITWDEAYQILISRMGRPPLTVHPSKIVFDLGQQNPLLNRFVGALGNRTVIDRRRSKNLITDMAWKITTHSRPLIPDISRSRTILNFGSNPFAHHHLFLGMAQRLSRAIVDNGAKLYTLDVRLSETAAKSTAWMPVRSGTDGAVALSMAQVILRNNLADRDFMAKMTDVSIPQLEKHVSEFTPEKVQEISGVEAAWIEKAAVDFATRRPSVALVGGGAADHLNGVQTVRCVLLLNWLVGNLEQPGGLYISPEPLQTSSGFQSEKNSTIHLTGTNDLVQTGSEIDFYFSYLSDPLFDEVNCTDLGQFLCQTNKVSFVAVMDTHLTETASIADLVLPAATPLECWGLEYAPAFDQKAVLNFQQPAVSLISPARVLRSPEFETGKITEPSFQPAGEAKEAGNVCIELAHRLGKPVTEFFPFKNVQEFLSLEAAGISGLSAAGGMMHLKKEGFWLVELGKSSTQSQEDPVRSKPISIDAGSSQIEGISGLPEFEPIWSHRDRDEEELVLTPFKTGFIDKNTANSKWLREISHENLLWVNPKTASKYGIGNGDKVQIFSSAGSLITRALVTDRIHPESVALAQGFGHRAVGSFAQARKNKTKDRDTNLVWWNKSGPGVNPNRIIGLQMETSSGAYADKDTLVRLKKI